MAANEKTSGRIAKIASKLLRKKSTSEKVKKVAGSALTQAADKKAPAKKAAPKKTTAKAPAKKTAAKK